jgi:hypothetical protein
VWQVLLDAELLIDGRILVLKARESEDSARIHSTELSVTRQRF